ncbi:hypothetical protein ACFC1B_07000 [Streptomyces xiamenensis]|uniref:hypothetical protein n=1 Tax=Streptomyces xiamenensis TaxID=408015 RepID=UPI0035D90F11
MSVNIAPTAAAVVPAGNSETANSTGAGLVVARRRITAARDRATLTESDGGGTGRTDGND